MTRNEAINYLRSSGMTDDQIKTVADAFITEELNAYRKAAAYLLTPIHGNYTLHKWTWEFGDVITVDDVVSTFREVEEVTK